MTTSIFKLSDLSNLKRFLTRSFTSRNFPKLGTHAFEVKNILIGYSHNIKLVMNPRIFNNRDSLIWNVKSFNFTLPEFDRCKVTITRQEAMTTNGEYMVYYFKTFF